MNGRIYDPLLGRFLSADIVVQFPGNAQSFNRYSYVLNNPLSFTDPSGFNVSVDDEVKKGMVKAAEADEALLRASVTGDAPDLKSMITGSVATSGANSAEPAVRPATTRAERAAQGDGKGNPTPKVNPASPVAAAAAGAENTKPKEKAKEPAPNSETLGVPKDFNGSAAGDSNATLARRYLAKEGAYARYLTGC